MKHVGIYRALLRANIANHTVITYAWNYLIQKYGDY